MTLRNSMRQPRTYKSVGVVDGKPPPFTSRKTLTTTVVAKICSVAVTTVQLWERKGHLPSHKTEGGHRRFRKKDVLKFVNGKGRNLSKEALNELISNYSGQDPKSELGLKVDCTCQVEVSNGSTQTRFVFPGKLISINQLGFSVVFKGPRFGGFPLRKFLKSYKNLKVFLKGEPGYLANPLKGLAVNVRRLSENFMRMEGVFEHGVKLRAMEKLPELRTLSS